jgi:hypothetical protein
MKKTFAFVLFLLLITLGAASFVLLNTKKSEVANLPFQDNNEQVVVPEEGFPPENPSTEPGIIEGSLGYPSEGIPQDIEVCAENVETQDAICTSEHIKDSKFTYGEGYSLEVPPGKYYVYAIRPNSNYKAYYSEFVICGMKAECSSHSPIEVEVPGGNTISWVDPQDWYNQ